jgi:4-hydroxyphenylpyruvate dioxygenase
MQFTPWDNPMGTDGFEFIEFATPDPKGMGQLFERLGFTAIARHRTKQVTLYRQGESNFIVNAEPNSFAQRFAKQHGPSVCAVAFRVQDAKFAYERALELGGWSFDHHAGPMELNIPAIKGVGGSLIYFVDRWQGKNGANPASMGNISIYDVDFVPIYGAQANSTVQGHGLTYIDHITHNVHRGHMKEYAHFYERLFNFREQRYFDIEGKHTGLRSKAMVSPCGKIRIPINESSDDKSQIAEFLNLHQGEGVQHIAIGCDNIYAAVEGMKEKAILFQDTSLSYYKQVDARLPHHGENLEELKRLCILIDGETQHSVETAIEKKLLLQIFTQPLIGPIFFEVIQRKGDQGFGEGNFKALFESIELDQIRRGVLSVETADVTP